MKIGILAYQSAINFGANLQIASTFGYLKKQGHEPVVINFVPDDLKQFYASSVKCQAEAHETFMKKYCHLTAICRDDKEIASIIQKEGIDAVIIGSDAVAQHHPFLERLIFPTRRVFRVNKITSDRMFPNPFWGTFADYLPKDFPMAIMSASNQDSSYKKMWHGTRVKMRSRLEKMRYISARDSWTCSMYEYIFKQTKSFKVTPDPVFAFNQNVLNQPAEEEIRKKYGLDREYFLFSFLRPDPLPQEWLLEFEKEANSKGIDCVAFPFPSGIKFRNSLKRRIELPLSPIDWYCLIKYSKGYIGNNMHPIVVSLHNANPFFSFDNYGRYVNKYFVDDSTSKIKHILQEADLLDYRVSTCNPTTVAPTPAPTFVLSKLLNFEYEKTRSFSQKQYNAYDNMLKEILDSFSN